MKEGGIRGKRAEGRERVLEYKGRQGPGRVERESEEL